MRSALIRTTAGAGMALLAVVSVAATRPPAEVASRPTFDRGAAAETTFPWGHLVVTRNGDQAVLTFDDGTVAPGRTLTYHVPADGTPAGVPGCDPADMICWGTTTVDASLSVRVEVEYLDATCIVAGSPVIRTTVECTAR